MTASIARKSVTVAEYSLPSGKGNADGEGNREGRWRWRGKKKGREKDEESEVQSRGKHMKPLRDCCNLWLDTQTCFRWLRHWKMNESHKPERLSDGQQTGYTHLNLSHVCNCSLSQNTLQRSAALTPSHGEHQRNPQSHTRVHVHTRARVANTIHHRHDLSLPRL